MGGRGADYYTTEKTAARERRKEEQNQRIKAKLREERRDEEKPAGMKFSEVKNKKDLINYIEEQTNIRLEHDEKDMFNRKRNVLYTSIDKDRQRAVLELLNRHNVYVESHIKDRVWIHFK